MVTAISSVASSPLAAQLDNLEAHLREENVVLLKIVKSFRELDRVAHSLSLLNRNESFATSVPWWPMISVLGTFSSGKSTFINSHLGLQIQSSGNQAVDDKFTVICFGRDKEPRLLPGLALDADPRFPFYRISHDIERVADGEGRRVDAYLQLKTCAAEVLKGKILIDSPGFDADEQRTSTLRITDHIIALSDLVLVFFDARHPEPGAMQDTLEHLVQNTIHRPDSNKFLYILNQIDSTAREDNPEEVFGAWQRALAQKGLTAGKFYRIYDDSAAAPFSDEALQRRFESKRDADLSQIKARMQQVEVDRAYRVVGFLEKLARKIETEYVPSLVQAKREWRQGVLWSEAGVIGLLLVLGLGVTIYGGYWDGLSFTRPWRETFAQHPSLRWIATIVGAGTLGYMHFSIRKLVARIIRERLVERMQLMEPLAQPDHHVIRAFDANTRHWSPLLWTAPIGWNGLARRRVTKVLGEANVYVQSLNDHFADPSGSTDMPPEQNHISSDAPDK